MGQTFRVDYAATLFAICLSTCKTASSGTTALENTSSDCAINWSVIKDSGESQKNHANRELFAAEAPLYDYSNQYFIAKMRIDRGSKIALKLSGDYPYFVNSKSVKSVSYFGFKVYYQQTGDLVSSDDSSLSDVDISPKLNFHNPFKELFEFQGTTSEYEIFTVAQQDLNTLPADTNKLSLYDRNKGGYIELWYRLYSPDKNFKFMPPRISAVSSDDFFTAAKCPTQEASGTRAGLLKAATNLPPGADSFGVVQAFRPQNADGIYANKETVYVTSRFSTDSKQSIMTRFRAPKVGVSGATGLDNSHEEVRFWSVCLVGDIKLYTAQCIDQKNAIIDDEGFVNLLISSSVCEDDCKNLKMNYFPWPNFQISQALIFRQLLPKDNFIGSFLKVPSIPPIHLRSFTTDYRKTSGARKAIGDYGPISIQSDSLTVQEMFDKLR